MDSHDLSSFGSDLKAYISEATMTWYIHHEFSDCRCDTFSQGDGTRIKSNMTQSVDIYKLSTVDLYHLIQPHD